MSTATVPGPRSGPDPELAEIAQRIGELAGKARTDGTDTRVLDRMTHDLETGGTTLAGTDLVTAYPPEVLLPDAPRQQLWPALASWLSVIRDVLVFAPIALTWWRLRDALDAYQQQTGQDAFLLGWARGFPVGDSTEPTTVTLGTSAVHISLLIVLVVVLTLVLHVLQRSQENRLSREDERRQLGADLALATFLLATPAQPVGKPLDNRRAERLGAQLNASTQQLETALRRASEEIVSVLETGPGSRIQASLDGWTKAVAELSKLAESLTLPSQLAQDLIRIRQETAADEEKLRAALDALVTDLRRAQETAGQEIHRHDLALASVRELAQNLGASLLVFTERAENLVDSTRGIWQVVDRLDSRNGHWRPPSMDNADPPPSYRGEP